MALILFSLLNGVEILGKTDGNFSTDAAISVTYPFMVVKHEQAPGQYVLDLYPYSLTNQEGSHLFMRSAVISVSDIVPDMLEKEYHTRTSSLILNGALDAFANLG